MAKGTLQIDYEKLVLDNLDLKERIAELKAENRWMKKRIKAAVMDLPDCPDEAKEYLEQAMKGDNLRGRENNENRWIMVEEDVPKNLKRVLVIYYNDLGKKRTTVAEYVRDRTVLAEDYLSDDCPEEFYSSEYDEEKDCYWTPFGWYESTYCGEMNLQISEKVICWMTIPEQKE